MRKTALHFAAITALCAMCSGCTEAYYRQAIVRYNQQKTAAAEARFDFETAERELVARARKMPRYFSPGDPAESAFLLQLDCWWRARLKLKAADAKLQDESGEGY